MAVRAVLDTNVDRWEAGEFTLLQTPDVLLEYAEKLIETGVPRALVARFIARISQLGEAVRIEFFHLRHFRWMPTKSHFPSAHSTAMRRISSPTIRICSTCNRATRWRSANRCAFSPNFARRDWVWAVTCLATVAESHITISTPRIGCVASLKRRTCTRTRARF